MEFINDYDLNFNYHKDKSNVVGDALSRRSSHEIAAWIIPADMRKELERLNLEVITKGKVKQNMCALLCQPMIFEEIRKS